MYRCTKSNGSLLISWLVALLFFAITATAVTVFLLATTRRGIFNKIALKAYYGTLSAIHETAYLFRTNQQIQAVSLNLEDNITSTISTTDAQRLLCFSTNEDPYPIVLMDMPLDLSGTSSSTIRLRMLNPVLGSNAQINSLRVTWTGVAMNLVRVLYMSALTGQVSSSSATIWTGSASSGQLLSVSQFTLLSGAFAEFYLCFNQSIDRSSALDLIVTFYGVDGSSSTVNYYLNPTSGQVNEVLLNFAVQTTASSGVSTLTRTYTPSVDVGDFMDDGSSDLRISSV